MNNSIDKLEEKRILELKALKRKNRRRNAFMAFSVIQVASLCLLYYLGKSSGKE